MRKAETGEVGRGTPGQPAPVAWQGNAADFYAATGLLGQVQAGAQRATVNGEDVVLVPVVAFLPARLLKVSRVLTPTGGIDLATQATVSLWLHKKCLNPNVLEAATQATVGQDAEANREAMIGSLIPKLPAE